MVNLTSFERIDRTMKREPIDHIGVSETFWPEAAEKWVEQGYLKKDEIPEEHFDFDVIRDGFPNLIADLKFKELIIEETDEWKTSLDGNGATLKTFKAKSGVPEHIDFQVKDRTGWLELKEKLTDESLFRDRIDFESYRRARQKAKERKLYFMWLGANVFECMHPVCGHENMLVGMALDPEWVVDMCQTYAKLLITLQEILFEQEGKPDAVFYCEDLGFKERPFMSPKMYNDIIKPSHTYLFDYAHSIGCKVFLHSCGFIEPLIPSLIEAGIDCLQAMEFKAGMDPFRIKKNFGDQIILFGGFDVRLFEKNDIDLLDSKLREFIPIMCDNGGYILHSDHSIPHSVDYETYNYFKEMGLKISRDYC